MPLSPETGTGSDGTIAATARETTAEGREVARAAREMGCEFGKSPVVTSVHDETEAEVTGFSDTQIDTIRSTWPLPVQREHQGWGRRLRQDLHRGSDDTLPVPSL